MLRVTTMSSDFRLARYHRHVEELLEPHRHDIQVVWCKHIDRARVLRDVDGSVIEVQIPPIPHYSLAVLFVISHLAMGARAILLGHGAVLTSANRLAWVICGIGVAVSLLVTIAQLSVG